MTSARRRRPTGLSRSLFRLPIHVFRLRLGWLFLGRLLLLHHTGRRSGMRRSTVLEVVARDGESYVVASGFGPRSDWYRNVLADPEVSIVVRTTAIAAVARPLPGEEAEEFMAAYARRHPWLARQLCRRLLGFAVDGGEEGFREVGRGIPFVRLTPTRLSA
ncbi:nitroreductase family deazaflavin-dependent oxidoreductase [Saccharomonospora azurea]|uniref:nitroreductase family deazaflavin-dependent oxidoreductase n=1 Tax=Saccharomonospora azurea TaxID=40988 RepID=UPI003D8C711D